MNYYKPVLKEGSGVITLNQVFEVEPKYREILNTNYELCVKELVKRFKEKFQKMDCVYGTGFITKTNWVWDIYGRNTTLNDIIKGQIGKDCELCVEDIKEIQYGNFKVRMEAMKRLKEEGYMFIEKSEKLLLAEVKQSRIPNMSPRKKILCERLSDIMLEDSELHFVKENIESIAEYVLNTFIHRKDIVENKNMLKKKEEASYCFLFEIESLIAPEVYSLAKSVRKYLGFRNYSEEENGSVFDYFMYIAIEETKDLFEQNHVNIVISN